MRATTRLELARGRRRTLAHGHVTRWRALALVTLLPFAMAVSCNGDDDDDDDDVEVAQAEADGEVRCLIAEVDAGPPSNLSSVAPCNSSSSFRDLDEDDLVSVDSVGEAEVKISGCGPIYVFEQSSLQLKACRRTSSMVGASGCAISGTSAFQNKGCDEVVTIQTVSAEVVATGTWYTVSVDPETDATLVTVLDGEVEVIPYLTADEPEDRGDAQVVGRGEFYYTMPDDQLVQLGDIQPREVAPLVALTPVVRAIDEVVAFDSVLERSLADGIDPALADAINARVFRIGGFEADDLVAEGVARAITWQEVDPDSGLVLLPPDARSGISLTRVEFDPDTAAAFIEEAGAFGDGVSIIALDDQVATALADLAQDQLEAAGLVVVDIVIVDDPREAEQLFARSSAAGIPTLLLGA